MGPSGGGSWECGLLSSGVSGCGGDCDNKERLVFGMLILGLFSPLDLLRYNCVSLRYTV